MVEIIIDPQDDMINDWSSLQRLRDEVRQILANAVMRGEMSNVPPSNQAMQLQISDLQNEVSTKAPESEVSALQEVVDGLTILLNTKADETTMSALQDVIDALNAAMENKADASAILIALAEKADITALDLKADKTDLNAKANTVDVNVALSGKVGTDTFSAAMSGKADVSALNTKANASDVNSALAGKADVSALATKADASTVNAAISAKADTSTVNAALANKADVSALASKADQTTVNAALASKADTSALTAKANTTDVNTALAGKASVSDLAANAALDAKKPLIFISGAQLDAPKIAVVSAVVSGGNAVFYLTDNGLVSGGALFTTSQLSVQPALFAAGQPPAFGTPLLSADRKTLTVPVTKSGGNIIAALVNVLGATVPANGDTVTAWVLGK